MTDLYLKRTPHSPSGPGWALVRTSDNEIEAAGFISKAAAKRYAEGYNYTVQLDHTTHIGEKAVVRYEVWCDNCPWTYEDSDKAVASEAARQHEGAHRG